MGLNQLALASLARTSQLGGQEFESPFSGCDVVEASSHCTGHFGYKTSTPYMPHLSLLYEDLSDEEKKKAQEKANVLDESIVNLSFEVTRLALYETDTEDKTLKSWKKIAECNLDAN
ncbi:Cyclic phosphodiesterase [Camellia lanceoleosa]|uniref:Cyclic phosphodiesterase n=1 Tax=Camellia lanceoleosa TaxID=1840588 RepID=A0ACC0GLM9_9ERIC|nr:Cyclic phosphodiesterase [Camellia lanceoleosa]